MESIRAAGVGKDLAGVHDAVGIDGVLDASHQRDRVGAEVEFHELLLQQADAVFARERAAERDGRLEDLARGGGHAAHLFGVAPVAEDVRMQIAVADVPEQRDLERVRRRDRAHAAREFRDRAARYRDVLAEFVRPATRERRRDRAPRAPHPFRFGGVRGDANFARALGPCDLGDALRIFLDDALVVAVGAEEQNRLDVERQADRRILLDATRRHVVDQLDRGRQHARRQHGVGRLARVVDAREDRHRGPREARFAEQPERHLRDRAERAFGAGEKRAQIVAGHVLHRAAAGAQHGAVGQHDFQRQHVVGRHAVFQAARAAGVLGDVAADRALLERGRIGRVEQAHALDGGLQVGRDDAGPDHGHPVDRVDR